MPITPNFTHFELSQLTSLRPVPLSLDADIFRPSILPDRKDFTACVWTMERELLHIVDWMATWKGMWSIVGQTHLVQLQIRLYLPPRRYDFRTLFL